jgi:hypothetical protein
MLGRTITERWRGLRMKARLEFDLPEEQQEFDLCHSASDLYSNLWDLAQQIRTWRKHGHRFKDAEELLDALWEDCIDHDLLNF